MRKIIFIDLDGTLLGTHSAEISARNKAAVIDVIARGHEVVLCTGRQISRIAGLMEELGVRYAIACSGAVVYDRLGDKILQSTQLDGFSIDKIVAVSDGLEVAHIYATPMKTYTTNSEVSEFLAGIELVAEGELPKGIVSYSLYSFNYDDMRKFYLGIKKADVNVAGASKFIVEGVPYDGRRVYYIEIAPTGISKGSGVRFLLGLLGVSSDDAVALGDGYNDLEMFRAVKTRVAMTNAVDELKSIATHHTASNIDDGVAQFLENLDT